MFLIVFGKTTTHKKTSPRIDLANKFVWKINFGMIINCSYLVCVLTLTHKNVSERENNVERRKNNGRQDFYILL